MEHKNYNIPSLSDEVFEKIKHVANDALKNGEGAKPSSVCTEGERIFAHVIGGILRIYIKQRR